MQARPVPLPCSCSLKGAGAPLLEAACETSASSAHSWPCLAAPRQKTSVFIWRLLRHLIQLQIKGKEMCFEIEPLGRHRHQHANATRANGFKMKLGRGAAPGANRGLPAQGPSKALGGVWGCLLREGGGSWMWE